MMTTTAILFTSNLSRKIHLKMFCMFDEVRWKMSRFQFHVIVSLLVACFLHRRFLYMTEPS
jgi:hypothetical protein